MHTCMHARTHILVHLKEGTPLVAYPLHPKGFATGSIFNYPLPHVWLSSYYLTVQTILKGSVWWNYSGAGWLLWVGASSCDYLICPFNSTDFVLLNYPGKRFADPTVALELDK